MNILTSNAKHAISPWGEWEVLLDDQTCKVKRITVLPGRRLSYQKHFRRSERWIVVEGCGIVTVDGKNILINESETIEIGCEAAHRMTNKGEKNLTFIEIQRGEYFGEDDIIRLEDDYGRE